jgi:hypothetical protein
MANALSYLGAFSLNDLVSPSDALIALILHLNQIALFAVYIHELFMVASQNSVIDPPTRRGI